VVKRPCFSSLVLFCVSRSSLCALVVSAQSSLGGSWCFRQPLFEVSVVFSAVSGYRCSLCILFGLFFSTSLRYSTVEFYLFSMDSAPVCVKFTGTNYSTWAFQFEFFSRVKLFGVILMARMLKNHPLLTNLRLTSLLLHGLCLMHASCLGFLVRWSPILSPTCGPIDLLNPCGLT
jgi:hypothetical protein